MITAFNYILKKKVPSPGLQSITHLAFLVLLTAFLSQNMDKECARGCSIGTFHLLLT